MKRKKILWMLLLIPLVASMTIANVSAPPPTTNLYVDPSWVWAPPGTQFSVDIKVSIIKPAQRLWAYQIELIFNPDVLQGVSYENGPFMESRGGHAEFIPGGGFDNTIGKLYPFGAYMDPIQYLPYGIDGVLATVTFEVVGTGESGITLSDYSILVNSAGFPIPAPLNHGFVVAEPGPELFIRKRGAHGGGVWPEWHVGLVTSDQTLHARVMNYGEVGAMIKVCFEVSGVTGPTEPYEVEATIDAATWVDDDIVPGEVTVSVSFNAGLPGKYTVNAKLYFIAGPLTEWTYFGSEGIYLDGEAASRDIATTYKVVTKL